VAGRRIQVARCIARHPELLEPLRGREINLSTIALIAGVLDDGNVKELLDAIRGKSQREVEQIVATYRPAVDIRDRVRPVRVRREASGGQPEQAATPLFSATVGSSNGIGLQDGNDTRSQVSHSRSGSRTRALAAKETVGSACSRPEEAREEPQFEEPQFKVQFAAGPAFVRKLEEARAILSSRSPGLGLEEVLETALDAFLDQNSPFRRKARRERSNACRSSETPIAPGLDSGRGEPGRSRHVPAAVRDAVFARDGGRCTYVGVNGIPCGSRHRLHVDHVEPFARGGAATPENLRLLCAPHNQLEAERVYGSDWMRRSRGG
jgi:5-methylcytosine-specific restriction endonuclease McrA